MNRRSALAAAALLVLAVGAEAQTTRVKWQPGTDFSKYQTYAWMDGTNVEDDTNHRTIMEFVDAQLGINGIFMDEQQPNLYVVYHASAKDDFQLTGGYGTDWRGANAITVTDYMSGTLVIDLVDAAENHVVWRAVATASVSHDPKKNRATVQRALDKMFADFPPG